MNSECYFHPDLACHLRRHLCLAWRESFPHPGYEALLFQYSFQAAWLCPRLSEFVNRSWLTESFLRCLCWPGTQMWRSSSSAAFSSTSIRTMACLLGVFSSLAGWQLISCFYLAEHHRNPVPFFFFQLCGSWPFSGVLMWAPHFRGPQKIMP